MTQPDYVPIAEVDQVRPSRTLAVPGPWFARRPAEFRGPTRPTGHSLGTPGPDQGYALKLARRFEDQVRLGAGESVPDVLLGCALVASRRAAIFGRAPVIDDLLFALNLFGFLGPAPEDLGAMRQRLFRSLSHGYSAQRRLVDLVPESILSLPPAEVRHRVAVDWQSLFDAGPSAE